MPITAILALVLSTGAVGRGRSEACSVDAIGQEKASVEKQLWSVTAEIFGSAADEADNVIDLNIAALPPGLKEAATIAQGISRVTEAIERGKPAATVRTIADPLLQLLKLTYPQVYSEAVEVVGHTVKAYDEYTRGNNDKAAGASVDGAAQLSIRLLREEALASSVQKMAETLSERVYDAIRTGAQAIHIRLNAEKLKSRHERLIRQLGDINRRMVQCATQAGEATYHSTTAPPGGVVPAIPKDRCDRDYLNQEQQLNGYCSSLTLGREWCFESLGKDKEMRLDTWRRCKAARK